MKDIDSEKFRERLNIAMMKQDLNGEQISRLTGASKDSVNSWRRGTNLPNSRKLFKICTALEISSDWLLGLSDDERI